MDKKNLKLALDDFNLSTGQHIEHLKPLQVESLSKALSGDCFVSLKTGYGKSLIFQLIPYILKSVIVVVCPLDVIVTQFVERFDGAVRIDDVAVEEDLSGVRYLIGHPESLTSRKVDRLLQKLGQKVSDTHLKGTP